MEGSHAHPGQRTCHCIFTKKPDIMTEGRRAIRIRVFGYRPVSFHVRAATHAILASPVPLQLSTGHALVHIGHKADRGWRD